MNRAAIQVSMKCLEKLFGFADKYKIINCYRRARDIAGDTICFLIVGEDLPETNEGDDPFMVNIEDLKK